MAQEPAEAPAPGTAVRPVLDDGTVQEAEVGSASSERPSAHGKHRASGASGAAKAERPASEEIRGGAVAEVAATGTALTKGERTSGLDLDDAPGAAGPGAG